MVLMHRREIIEKYGFDPGQDTGSVVPKSEGPTAAINIVPDADKVEQPSHETPSADLLPNMAAGALKSFTSDPAMLAGLGYGVYYWTKRKLSGDKEADFAEGLYKEGGIQNVQSHIGEKYKTLKEANPDWDDSAIKEEIERYTASDEFFKFNTDQMIGPLGAGLQLANRFNKELGVGKNPNQETFSDDMMQTLGAILTPTGALKLGKVAEKFASKVAGDAVGKAARVAGAVVDYTLVPGVSKYSAGQIAGNMAGGAVIDEAVRHATDDPTVLPSGTAFAEFNKEQERLPLGQPIPHIAEPIVPVDEASLSPAPEAVPLPPVEAMRMTKQADLGASGAVAGGVAALLAARQALRGRVAPLTPTANPVTHAEDVVNSRIAETGLTTPPDPGVVERIDQKVDQYAPLYQVGRELDIEDQIKVEVGQYLSRGGQERVLRGVFDDGIMPNGTVVEPVRIHFDRIASLAPPDLEEYRRAVVSENILFEINEARTQALADLQNAGNRLAANPNDPNAIAAHTAAQQTMGLWNQYDPSIRRYMPRVDEAALQANRHVPGRNPNVDAAIESRARANDTVNDLLLQSGIIDQATRLDRARNRLHTGLFEYNPNTKVAYDPTEARIRSLDPVTDRVHNILDPESSLRLSIENAANAAARNLGMRNIHRSLQAADPQGSETRVVPAGDPLNEPQTGVFRYRQNGQEVVVQTARPHLADAINISSIDDGIAVNVLNTLRAASQFGMVHGAAGIGQAPVSLFYDMALGWATQRAGTSYGYLSRWIRQVERLTTTAGSIPAMTMGRIADLVDVVDAPGRLAAMGVTFAQAVMLNSFRVIGHRIMRDLVVSDGFFNHLANSIPNGHQVLGNIAGRMSTHFAASWAGAYRRFGEVNTHAMILDLNLTRDRIARDMEMWSGGTPSGIREELKRVFRGYNAALNTIGSLNKMTFFAQQYAIARTGRQGGPRVSEQRLIAEQARTSSGDMHAQHGGTFLRRFGKIIPFSRIGLQSLRHLIHAMTSRGAWDSSLVMGRMATLSAAMYGSAKMMEELGLQDWYYEQLNDFERVGKLHLLKLEKWRNKMMTGDWGLDMENPANNFYSPGLPPEMSLFNGTFMYGMEQFGMVNRGSNRGNTSAEKDLLYSLAQTFNVGNIPAVSAVASLAYGQKVDLTAGLRGRSPVSEIKGSKAQYGDQLPSGIPVATAEAFKSVFGFNGMLAVQSLDAAGQAMKAGKSATEAMARAWDEGSNLFKEKSTPSVPGLWDAKKKVYGVTAMSSEISRINNVADQIKEAYTNEFTPGGAGRGENRRLIYDDEVKEILYATHSFFDKGAMLKVQKQLSQIQNEIADIRASKGKLPFAEVDRLETEKFKEMRPWHDEMMSLIQMYQEYLAENYGERFQREGLKPDADSAVKLVKKYSR